jgi:hypothetical protein
MLKEKCIYYNPVQEGYYLVLSIGEDLVYGRRGDFEKTSNLEDWINQDGPGIRFKIDDIIINRDYIRNYYLDEKCLDQFELVRELSDEEFYLIEILTNSRYRFPATLIDINKYTGNEEILDIIRAHKDREKELKKLKKEIYDLEKELCISLCKFPCVN